MIAKTHLRLLPSFPTEKKQSDELKNESRNDVITSPGSQDTLKGKQGRGGRMGGLEVGVGGYTGPWLNSKSRFRFSFLKNGTGV